MAVESSAEGTHPGQLPSSQNLQTAAQPALVSRLQMREDSEERAYPELAVFTNMERYVELRRIHMEHTIAADLPFQLATRGQKEVERHPSMLLRVGGVTCTYELLIGFIRDDVLVPKGNGVLFDLDRGTPDGGQGVLQWHGVHGLPVAQRV